MEGLCGAFSTVCSVAVISGAGIPLSPGNPDRVSANRLVKSFKLLLSEAVVLEGQAAGDRFIDRALDGHAPWFGRVALGAALGQR